MTARQSVTGEHEVLEGFHVAGLEIVGLVDIEFVHHSEATLKGRICLITRRWDLIAIGDFGENHRGYIPPLLILPVNYVFYRGGYDRRTVDQKCLPARHTLASLQLTGQKLHHIV